MNVSTDIDSDTELDDDELFESDTDFDPELEASDVDESFELDSGENDIWFEGGSVSLEATDVEEDPFSGDEMEDDDLGMGTEIDLAEGADYRVIAPDTRRRVRNTRRRPFRYICKIDPPGCTGTLIAPCRALRLGQSRAGQFPRGLCLGASATSTAIRWTRARRTSSGTSSRAPT